MLDCDGPLSQYELIIDILEQNKTLLYVHCLVNWLNKTGTKSFDYGIKPLIFTKAKEADEDVSLDPDVIFNRESVLDDRTRYEHTKLIKQVVCCLRRGHDT